MDSYHDYLVRKGYSVPTDDEDEIIEKGQKIRDMEERGETLPATLDWST